VAQHQLVVLPVSGKRARVAVDAQNRAGHFCAGLPQDEVHVRVSRGAVASSALRRISQLPAIAGGSTDPIGTGVNRCARTACGSHGALARVGAAELVALEGEVQRGVQEVVFERQHAVGESSRGGPDLLVALEEEALAWGAAGRDFEAERDLDPTGDDGRLQSPSMPDAGREACAALTAAPSSAAVRRRPAVKRRSVRGCANGC